MSSETTVQEVKEVKEESVGAETLAKIVNEFRESEVSRTIRELRLGYYVERFCLESCEGSKGKALREKRTTAIRRVELSLLELNPSEPINVYRLIGTFNVVRLFESLDTVRKADDKQEGFTPILELSEESALEVLAETEASKWTVATVRCFSKVIARDPETGVWSIHEEYRDASEALYLSLCDDCNLTASAVKDHIATIMESADDEKSESQEESEDKQAERRSGKASKVAKRAKKAIEKGTENHSERMAAYTQLGTQLTQKQAEAVLKGAQVELGQTVESADRPHKPLDAALDALKTLDDCETPTYGYRYIGAAIGELEMGFIVTGLAGSIRSADDEVERQGRIAVMKRLMITAQGEFKKLQKENLIGKQEKQSASK